MDNYKIVIFLFAFVSTGCSVKLPESFKKCKVGKAFDFVPNECLREAVEAGIKELSVNGSKDLGVFDLDPLKINQVLIDQGGDRPVAIKLVFTDNELIGLSNIKVLAVDGKMSSPEKFEMNIRFFVDSLQLIGPYVINGKVLILPIQGDGKSNMTMAGVKAKFALKGVPQTKNGKEYLKITGSQLQIDLSRMHFDLQNLFNGNKALGDNMNKFLNENWLEIFGELKESIQNAFSKVLEAYAMRIVERVQYKNLFLLE